MAQTGWVAYATRVDDTVLDTCRLLLPDGRVMSQSKLHITPSERSHRGVEGGSLLSVFPTSKASA